MVYLNSALSCIHMSGLAAAVRRVERFLEAAEEGFESFIDMLKVDSADKIHVYREQRFVECESFEQLALFFRWFAFRPFDNVPFVRVAGRFYDSWRSSDDARKQVVADAFACQVRGDAVTLQNKVTGVENPAFYYRLDGRPVLTVMFELVEGFLEIRTVSLITTDLRVERLYDTCMSLSMSTFCRQEHCLSDLVYAIHVCLRSLFGGFAISRASAASVEYILRSVFNGVRAIDISEEDHRRMHDRLGPAPVCIRLGDDAVAGDPFDASLREIELISVGGRTAFVAPGGGLGELAYAPYYFRGTWDGDSFSIRALPYRVGGEDRTHISVLRIQVTGPSDAVWNRAAAGPGDSGAGASDSVDGP